MSSATEIAGASLLRLELDGDLSRIRMVAARVQAFLHEHGCSDQTRADCELILVEACNNAIKHSDASARGAGSVIVETVVDPETIELRIIDHGPGFDWPEKATLPGPEKESGRGLFLINALTDHAAYHREPHQNTLVLRKKRFSASALPATNR